jgi:hypothetical protein
MLKARFLFIGFCVAVMMFSNSACAVSSSGSTPDDKLLSTNYELWESKHIANYSFDIRISVFVPGSKNLIHIEVRDNVVQSYHQETVPYATFPDFIIQRYDTIEKLFAQIEDAYENEVDTISVSYDAELGFPNHAEVNPELDVFDEEWGFAISDFTPLEDTASD